MSDRRPIDGTAVILHMIEAARADHRGGCAPESCGGSRLDPCALSNWLVTLDRFIEQAAPEESPVGWEARRWRELVEGDRVALGGVEAVVLSVMVQQRHVDPNSSEYRPEPLEHEVAAVRLEGVGVQLKPMYWMAPDGEVETLRGELGQERDRAAGRGRAEVDEQRAGVLGHWASEAWQTLAAAGLKPSPVS